MPTAATTDKPWGKWISLAVFALLALYLVTMMYATGQALLAFFCLCAFALTFYIYVSDKAYAYRYMLPGLAGMALFVVFPMVYTIAIGFTNYSSPNHLLTYERATQVLLSQTYAPEGTAGYEFSVHPQGSNVQLVLTPSGGGERLISEPIDLVKLVVAGEPVTVVANPLLQEPAKALPLKKVIELRNGLDLVSIALPDGSIAIRKGLKRFAPSPPALCATTTGP
jgi:maltose/maltodextrin transport system permease protein